MSYKSLNVTIPPVSEEKIKDMLKGIKSKPADGRKRVEPKPVVPRRPYRIYNEGFKLALVALFYGSLTDLSKPR